MLSLSEYKSSRNLKILLVIFFIYIFAEGVLRKWVIPGVPGSLLYAVKYVILLSIAIVYFGKRSNLFVESSPQYSTIKGAFGLYIIILILSAITLTMFYNGPIVAAITLLQYSAPIILIYTIPAVVRSEYALDLIIKVFTIITLCVLVLAIVQYFSPPLSPINKYAEEMKNGIARVGSAARICSVFSYLTPLGNFCVLSGTFCLSLLMCRSRTKYEKYIMLSLLLMAVTVAFMNGSRSVVILLFASLLFIIFKEGIGKGNFTVLAVTLLVVFVAIYLYETFGISAVDNFVNRVNSANDADTRISRMMDYGRMTDYSGLFGYGIGIANLSVQSMLTTRAGIDFEEEIGRIVIEFGFVGFIFVSLIRAYVWFLMLSVVKQIQDSRLKMISWATLIVITPMSFYIQMCLYNWFAYMVYFSMIGLNIALLNIDRNHSVNCGDIS